MKARYLAEKLMENPDFDVQFSFADDVFPNLRTFEHVVISDIGYLSKVIVLDGEERK